MDSGLLTLAHLVTSLPVQDGVITEESTSPGAVGFFLFLALGVGTFLLWRSMNKQLKRVDFDESAIDESAIDAGRVVDVTDAATAGADGSKPGSGSTERDSQG